MYLKIGIHMNPLVVQTILQHILLLNLVQSNNISISHMEQVDQLIIGQQSIITIQKLARKH